MDKETALLYNLSCPHNATHGRLTRLFNVTVIFGTIRIFPEGNRDKHKPTKMLLFHYVGLLSKMLFVMLENMFQKSTAGSWNRTIAVLELMKDKANANKHFMTSFNNSWLILFVRYMSGIFAKGHKQKLELSDMFMTVESLSSRRLAETAER